MPGASIEAVSAAGEDPDVRALEKTSDHAPVWIELADKPKRRRKATARQTA